MWNELESLVKSQSSNPGDVADVLAYLGSPSTSIAVLDHGKITSKCYSTNKAHNTDTVFQACSISKPMAALAAMRLVDRGQLDINKPISEYLSPKVLEIISTPETAHLVSAITSKRLMSHTAGLTVHGFLGYLNDTPDIETILSGQAPSNVPQVRLADFPGHRFTYSGGGTTVLQLVLQQITTQSFPELMQDLVFGPLEMTQSHYNRPSSGFAPAQRSGTQPYEFPYRVFPEMAAAGLWTTPTDLLKACLAVQKSVAGAPSSFLKQETARLMLTEVQDGFGIGFMVPYPAFGHSGSNVGYRCDLFAYDGSKPDVPEYSGVAVMTNSDEGVAVFQKLEAAVLYLMSWPDVSTEPPYASNAIVPLCDCAATVDAQWTDWSGRWGDFEISEKEGQPLLTFVGGGLSQNISLIPAARPRTTDGAIDLSAKGLELMVRLTKKDGEKVVELWHGRRDDIRTLHKAAGH